MVITYFLSVYNGVTARKTFAAALHLWTGKTADAAALIAALAADGQLGNARGYLTDIGDSLLQIQQTHSSYPVLRYFHFRFVKRATCCPGSCSWLLTRSPFWKPCSDPTAWRAPSLQRQLPS